MSHKLGESNTAVLIHGCHLQANLGGKKWEDIVWGGESPTLYGRATMGLKIALKEQAKLVIFSTGASERDGIKEGDFTLRWAFEHSDEIAPVIGSYKSSALRGYLRCRAGVDIVSQNTREECERNLRLAARHGCDRIILVSSPWHIERCHAEALKVAEEMRVAGAIVPEISAMASYGSTEDICILESPHRGDRPRTKFHQLAPRFFKVPPQRLKGFEDDLEKLLRSYGV